MPSIGSGLFSVGLASAGGLGTRVGAAFVEVFADTSGLSKGFASAETQMTGFAARLGRSAAGFTAVGSSLTRYVSVPLAAAGGVAIKMAADFDTAMTRTSALAGIAAKDLSGFREEIFKLAHSTAQAPTDLANALYFIGSAGLRDSQILPVLTASAQAAGAQMTDAATAGHLLTGVLVAYGKDAPTASAAMDVLTAAIQQGKAEPADLAANLGTVIPAAAQMGVSFDELAGAVAAATNVNINAARAATGLRYMLIQLMHPTDAAKQSLADYGMTIGQLQNQVTNVGLVPALDMLAKRFDLTSVKGKSAFFDVVGGVRAGNIALALVGENAARTNVVLDATAAAAGNVNNEFQDAFHTMQSTPEFKFQQAWTDLKVAAIQAGEVLLPIGLQIVQTIGNVGHEFAVLDPIAQKSIVNILLVGTVLGPVLYLFGKFQTVIGGVIKVWRVFSDAAAARAAAVIAAQEAETTAVEAGAVAGEQAYADSIAGAQAAAAAEAQADAERIAAIGEYTAAKEAEGAMVSQVSAEEVAAGQATAGLQARMGMPVNLPATGAGTGLAGGLSPVAPVSSVGSVGSVVPAGAAGELRVLTTEEELAAIQARNLAAGEAEAVAKSLALKEAGIAGAGGLSTLGAGMVGTVGSMLEMTAIMAGVVAGGAKIINTFQDITTSNSELALSSGLTQIQVAALKDQLSQGATGLNPFTSMSDKIQEAGTRYAAVLRDATAAGVPLAQAQQALNGGFESALEKIGGLTGSMPAFEQQLRSLIPALHTVSPEVNDLRTAIGDLASTSGTIKIGLDMPKPGSAELKQLQDSLAGNVIPVVVQPQLSQDFIKQMSDMGTHTTQAITGIQTEQYSKSVQTLLADINGALAGGAKLDDVMRVLGESARAGSISWGLFGSVIKELGLQLPTADLGQWSDLVYRATGGTDAQRRSMADMVRVAQQLGAKIKGTTQNEIAYDLANGHLSAGLKLLTHSLAGPLQKAIQDHKKELSKSELAAIRAAQGEGDYRTAVLLLNKALRMTPREKKVAVKVKVDHAKDLVTLKHNIDAIPDKLDMRVPPELDVINGGLDDISKKHTARVTVSETGLAQVANGVKNVPDGAAKVLVTADGISTVQQNINGITGKTVYIKVVPTHHEGGPVFHSGGIIGGTGERMIKALAGEHVTNVRSTRAWFDTLQAINRDDATGVLRSLARRGAGRGGRGGPTVVNGGNINIHLVVSGYGGDARQLARQVGREVSKSVASQMGGFALGG